MLHWVRQVSTWSPQSLVFKAARTPLAAKFGATSSVGAHFISSPSRDKGLDRITVVKPTGRHYKR